MSNIHDVNATLIAGPGDELAIKREQHIPDAFLKELRDEKLASTAVRAGEFMRVASIPVALVEQWLREGYDIQKEPVQKTLARLRAAHLDAFITTNKRV